jgi:MHS family proline/betaine transporter-like MFS transporter
MRAATVAAVVLAWPMFALLIANPTVWGLTVVEVILGIIMALYFGPLPALLSELFPTQIRTTGLSISYNLGVTLFGGFAPLVLTWLIDRTGSLHSPSLYYIAIALLSLVGLFVARSRFVTR